jgi:hypothetical protein
MRLASALVPTFSDDVSIARNHATNAGIRLRRRQPARRKFKRARHHGMIECIELIGHGFSYLRSIGVTGSDGNSGS